MINKDFFTNIQNAKKNLSIDKDRLEELEKNMKKTLHFKKSLEAGIRNNYYESMQKLNKIENIDHYISDTSPNADFKLYSKHFELIDLFLISTLEKDTILNDPTHKRMNENVDKLIKDETIRETLKTHLEDIKTTLSNINNVRGFMGDEERNLYNIKLSGTVDSISNKIELTNLNLFNYNVLNEDVIQDNIVAAGGLDEINNRKREYIDLNCINLLPIDQWDKINITDDSFKYHNGNLNSDSSDTYNKLTADDLKKFLIFNKHGLQFYKDQNDRYGQIS